MSLQSVREAFNNTAPSMDTVVVRNPINAWIRQVNSSLLVESFPPGSQLIELGCGTGDEAIMLANHGCRVLALDISDGMVAKAREKVQTMGLEDRIQVQQGRIADLASLVDASPWKSFDGAYASFSLTYEPDLRDICESLFHVLKPGTLLLCTLPNRLVLSEVVIYGAQLRLEKVTWRFKRPLYRQIAGHTLRIHAYSPWEMAALFEGSFELQGLVGLPVFLPPIYLHDFYRRLGKFQTILKQIDSLLAKRFPWNNLGDHTFYRFKRLS